MKTFSRFQILTMTLVGISLFSNFSSAREFVGTIIVSKGDVKILTEALPKTSRPKKFVLYEGAKYSFKRAKIGLRLRPRQIVQTGTDGKAKVAYSNGDHFILSPGSSVSMPAPDKKQKESSQLQLFYGKLRALVSKRGPRKKMNVKTKSAVAGVRGTDFFMGYSGSSGTDLTVLRGAVEIFGQANPKKSATVKTGFRALVPEPKKPTKKSLKEAEAKAEKAQTKPVVMQKGGLSSDSAVPEIALAEATKSQLLEIQKASDIKTREAELTSLSKKDAQRVITLQKKALQTVIDDIKQEDPELYKKLKSKKNIQESEINTQVVGKLYKQAPAAKKSAKPQLNEIDQIGKDVYDKYFKE